MMEILGRESDEISDRNQYCEYENGVWGYATTENCNWELELLRHRIYAFHYGMMGYFAGLGHPSDVN